MKKIIGAVVTTVAVSICAIAADYHWTGKGGDGKWTNPANWAIGGDVSQQGIPGQYKDENGTIVGEVTDKAIFGAVDDGAFTTIDLKDQYLIDHVVITNGAPSYTFGAETYYAGETDSDGNPVSDIASTDYSNVYQNLGVAWQGGIRICKDVTTDQVFHRPAVSGGHGSAYRFYNDSPTALFIYHFPNNINGSKGGWGGTSHHFYGIGSFKFTGQVLFACLEHMYIYHSGIFHIDDRSDTYYRYARVVVGNKKQNYVSRVHILSACTLRGYSEKSKNASDIKVFKDMLAFQNDGHIFGEGVILVAKGSSAGSVACTFYLNADCVGTIDSGIVPRNASVETDFIVDGFGTLCVNTTNSLTGTTRIMQGATLCAKMIGNKGTPAAESSIAAGDTICFEGLYDANGPTQPSTSKLKYTGVGGETDRTLMVSNCFVSVRATNTFANAGTGLFNLKSDIVMSPEITSAAFCLSAETAPLVFTGAFEAEKEWSLQIKGDDVVKIVNAQASVTDVYIEGGTLEIASKATLPNASTFVLNGGALRLTDENVTHTLPLEFAAGANEVVLSAGSILEFDTLSVAEGAVINFVVPEDGTSAVIVKNASGNLPEGVTWNGFNATLNEEGKMVPLRTQWKSAVSGSWNDDTKWDNSVPAGANDVVVAASGASYTVSIDSPLTQMFKNLFIGNETDDMTTEVCINQSLINTDARIDVLNGGVLSIGAEQKVVFEEGAALNLFSNGTFKVYHSATSDVKCIVNQDGGTIDVGGDLILTNQSASLNTGRTLLKDNGSLMVEKCLDVRPNNDGEVAELTMSNSALVHFVDSDSSSVRIGVQGVEGRSIVNLNGDGKHFNSNPYSICVGWRNGYGELNLNSGSMGVGNHCLLIGSESYLHVDKRGDGKVSDVIGVLNVNGGTLNSSPNALSYYSWAPIGTFIGNGLISNSSDSKFEGVLNLNSGNVNITLAPAMVGAGLGKGTINQTGGVFTFDSKQDISNYGLVYYALALGYLGGQGTYNLSGGEAVFKSPIYVGGATEEDVQTQKLQSSVTAQFKEGPKTEGFLNVSGGTFTCSTNIIVGALGEGTVTLSGTGVLTTHDLILSNSTATLKFVFDEKSTGKLNVTNDLVICDGAKMVVDMSRYAGTSSYLPMAEVYSFVGQFDEDDIEFIMPEGSSTRMPELCFERNGVGGLWVKMPPNGTVIILR